MLQLVLGGFPAAALTMHKWVAGWHTPDRQSEPTRPLSPPGPLPEGFGMQSSLGALHLAALQAEFASQLVLGGCAAAALIMHKWVAGWHTPDLQSELILHLAPTLPATCASAVLLPLAPAPIAQIAAPMTKTRNCRVAMPVDPMKVSTARDSADRFCISIHQRSKARTC